MDVFDLILNIGSVAGLISIFYQIHNNRKNMPRIAFTFEGSWVTYDERNPDQAVYHFQGIIKNQSLKPNSVVRLWLTVWDNKKRGSTLRTGHSVCGIEEISDADNKLKISLPLYLDVKAAKKVEIQFPLMLSGSRDGELLRAVEKLSPDSELYLPKYTWEFMIEDTAENLFDYYKPQTMSRKLHDLWWTLPNYTKSPIKYTRHVMKIFKETARHKLRRVIENLGFYR